MGEWIYGITWKHVLPFTFFVYLFFCLIIFSHFYISNVWFVLANSRVLVFIFNFIILKFITMFLPVNVHKFCKRYCYCKWYIWKQPFKGFLWKKSIYFMYTWGIHVAGLISSKAAGSMSSVLVGVRFFVGVFEFQKYFGCFTQPSTGV